MVKDGQTIQYLLVILSSSNNYIAAKIYIHYISRPLKELEHRMLGCNVRI